ncbi:hypothetical protein ABZV93_06865 [Actinopolymorpha sp. NPDC004070]|uniref:hypothetical protein n=1 Tax=Actinopolymorpha sp. NPDC004070 TaxID=3154548 RepID=UPI0033A0C8ED
MSDTPLYDQLVNERLGRGPSEFEGHDTWDDSEEARAAFERGVAHARTQQGRADGPEQGDPAKPSAEATPAADERTGAEKGADRKQFEQPAGEQQQVPGQKQDEGRPAAKPESAKEPQGKPTPGKPLTPA